MPAWDSAASTAAAAALRLPGGRRRVRLGTGTRLGAGPGASLEFLDHRAYVPGDDPRQLDWSVYARSDQLVIRRQRVETIARCEVVLDTSASMDHAPGKGALAAALAATVLAVAQGDGMQARLWLAGDGRHAQGRAWPDLLKAAIWNGGDPASGPPLALAPGSDRWYIGDGLSPAGGAAVLKRIAHGAARCTAVHVLDAAEIDPGAFGAARLVDAEHGAADLVVDDRMAAGYRERFARHLAGWQSALQGLGTGPVVCPVGEGLSGACARLVRDGALVPAAGRR